MKNITNEGQEGKDLKYLHLFFYGENKSFLLIWNMLCLLFRTLPLPTQKGLTRFTSSGIITSG